MVLKRFSMKNLTKTFLAFYLTELTTNFFTLHVHQSGIVSLNRQVHFQIYISQGGVDVVKQSKLNILNQKI